MRLLWGVLRLAIVLVGVQAVREQLGRPAEERTWRGRVGPVPYDFRVPTLDQFKAAYWNPDDPRIFTDRVFGIGWAVNIPQAIKVVNELVQQGDRMRRAQ
jgi:hypothetical protein